MSKEVTVNSQKLNITMNSQQLDRVVEAIIAGKYSWACVLTLRFAGCNPLLYIPYRTYNRLLKENSSLDSVEENSHDCIRISKNTATASSEPVSRITASIS